MADFVTPDWVKTAKQTIGTDVEPVYPMKTVHGGNQVPDTEAAPIGYRYDNGKSQYQYLDLGGKPTNLVNRGNLGEAFKTLAPIGLSMIGANFLAPALSDLFGPATSDLFGGGGDLGMGAGAGDFLSGAQQLTPAAIESGLGTAGYGANASALTSGLFNPATIGAGAGLTAADLLAGTTGTNVATTLGDVAATGSTLTPAAIESGLGTAGYGANASAAASGLFDPALIGAGAAIGAGSTLADVAATGAKALTPAAIESLGGTAGYGTNASALKAAIDAGINPAIVGAGAGLTLADLTAGKTGADLLNKVVTDTTGTKLVDTAAKVTDGTNVLKTLTDATGLTGTQLAALLSGLTGAGNAANLTSAINTGLDATTAANTASQGVLKDIYNQQLGFQAPYQATGVSGLNQINKLADTGYLTHQFDASDLAKGLAPNYDFMLQQGQMANQRAANVGGGALSGNTLQGLQNYTQNYAGNAYQNAFNNYQNQRQNIYGNLASMAGIGQTANQGAQAAGTAYGKGTTDLNTALANAQAAASIGKAQALAGGTSGLANSTFLASLLAPPK